MGLCEEAEGIQHQCYAEAGWHQERHVAEVEGRESKHWACMGAWQAGFGYAMTHMRKALLAQAEHERGL